MVKKMYRKLVSEKNRIRVRNIQYFGDELIFRLKLIGTKLKSILETKKADITSKSVCYIIPTSNITGGVAVCLEHLNGLKKMGWKTLIITKDKNTDLSWFPEQNVEVLNWKDGKKVVGQYKNVVATGWITAYDLLLLPVRNKFYFVQSNEIRFYPEGSYLRERVSRTYDFDFNFLTEAKWIKKWLKESFNQEAKLVENGINNLFFSQTKEQKHHQKTRILIEGAANLVFKGVKDCFNLTNQLPKEKYEIWYVSYDGKPQKDWRIDRFFYRVEMKKMKDIYSNSDFLLKLSYVEGFPGPPLEMMASGGIPICLDKKEYREYIIDGKNGFLIARNDIKKLLEILTLKQQEKNAIINQAKMTAKQYNWHKTIKKLNRIYNE